MKTYLTLKEIRAVVERKFVKLNDEHYTPEQQLAELYDKADEMASKKEYGLRQELFVTGLYWIEEDEVK